MRAMRPAAPRTIRAACIRKVAWPTSTAWMPSAPWQRPKRRWPIPQRSFRGTRSTCSYPWVAAGKAVARRKLPPGTQWSLNRALVVTHAGMWSSGRSQLAGDPIDNHPGFHFDREQARSYRARMWLSKVLPMDMLHAMRVFVRVVDAGSFTAAAQQTETSTAQVSRLVSDLENQLHARLLHRTTRRLALTETGERFLAQCRQILEQVEYARAEAGGAHLTPRGRLRVHALTGLGIQLLATLAGRYHERYPEVTMDLVLSQRQPDLLEDNLDVVITLSHELPDSELIAQTLGTVFHVVCASPLYLAQHGVPRVPVDLQAHRCLRLADPAFTDTWSFLVDGGEQSI